MYIIENYNIMGKYGNHIREDKSVLTAPICPFCKLEFPKPVEISTRLGFFTGGRCSCGAGYCFDASGKNMGEAFLDALVYVCNEDWDKAMSLESGVDYEEIYLNYNPDTHSFNRRGNHNYGSDIVFIKLKTN
jgi:hypothetical protein